MRQLIRCGVMTMVGAALAASAQESVTRSNDTEIVVTATREWTDAARTPSSMSVITSEQIERKAANNLSDVLRDVPGVNIRSLSGPVAEVAMRGGGENSQGRVLVLLDGRRLNNPDMAAMNWLQIPLNQIERVEVLRGSQSALYGDMASQGVINILTKQGSAEPRTELSFMAGSYNTTIGRAGAAGSSNGSVPLSYAANAEWQQSSGFRDRSGYEAAGVGGRIGCDFSPASGMSLAGSWYRSDYELPGDLTKAEMKDDPEKSHNPGDSTDNVYGNAGLDYFAEADNGARFDLGLGWSGKETASDVASWYMFSDTTLNSLSAQPRVTVDSAWAGLPHRTIVGLDLYQDGLTVDRYGEVAHTSRTIAADLEKETVGSYVRHQVELTPAWILNAGVRVEVTRVTADADSYGATVLDDELTEHGQAWEAGLTYAFEPGSKAFVRAGSVYRYPFLDEQISYYGFGSDTFYRDLDAEKGLNTEAGVEFGADPAWQAGLTLFRLDMRDEVAWDPIANRNENLDETCRQGAELWGRWAPIQGRLEFEGTYTHTDAEFTSGPNDGKEVPLVPEQLASGTVRIGLPKELWLDTTVRYAGECPLGGDVMNAGDKLDAYTIVNMMARYQPRGKRYSAFIGVDNVGDKTYATVAYKGFAEDGYYPAPGRNWRAGVSMTY